MAFTPLLAHGQGIVLLVGVGTATAVFCLAGACCLVYRRRWLGAVLLCCGLLVPIVVLANFQWLLVHWF